MKRLLTIILAAMSILVSSCVEKEVEPAIHHEKFDMKTFVGSSWFGTYTKNNRNYEIQIDIKSKDRALSTAKEWYMDKKDDSYVFTHELKYWVWEGDMVVSFCYADDQEMSPVIIMSAKGSSTAEGNYEPLLIFNITYTKIK